MLHPYMVNEHIPELGDLICLSGIIDDIGMNTDTITVCLGCETAYDAADVVIFVNFFITEK